jgi:hypothetical protein
VPEELVSFLLCRCGIDCDDPRTLKLICLASQQFVTEILKEAKAVQANRLQAPLGTQKAEGYVREKEKEKDRRNALLSEDLAKVLQKYSIKIQRQPYFVEATQRHLEKIGPQLPPSK